MMSIFYIKFASLISPTSKSSLPLQTYPVAQVNKFEIKQIIAHKIAAAIKEAVVIKIASGKEIFAC